MASIRPRLGRVSGQTVDRKRPATGTVYVGGRPTANAATVTTGFSASVQPPNSKYMHMIEQLPEGKSTKTWVVVYAELDVFVAADDRNNVLPDILVYEGDDY